MTPRQQAYSEAVESTLSGLRAVSFGSCPGCDECLDIWGSDHDPDDYRPDCDETPTELDHQLSNPPWGIEDSFTTSYTIRWPDGRESIATCAEIAADIVAEVKARMAREEAMESGEAYDEGSFSWSGCGICGCHLGGDRYVWHWRDKNGEIMHESDGCADCLMFWANGDPPEDEHLDWID